MKNFKKWIAVILSVACLAAFGVVLTSCGGNNGTVKIGVIREDDSSGEASAWEAYLNGVGKEMNITFDFTTTASSSDETSAIRTYASKGYKAVLLFSDDDRVSAVNEAANNKIYVAIPTGHPTDEQYEQIKDNPYYLGSVAPVNDTEYQAGYDMAKFFVEQKGQKNFTIFGGATLYGAEMHVHRLAGMLVYLCETEGTSYDGATTREALIGKLAGKSLDPSKFVSNTYKITGYMDGFAFDDAFSTKLTRSLETGGTCILSVGAGDTVAKIAYGISQASGGKITGVVSGGVDAITADYAACFDLGYSYDCGKFASAMGPGLILVQSALDGKKIVNAEGYAPKVGMNYWVATSKDELNSMLASDNATNGFCYNANVLNHFIGNTYEEFLKICNADYATSVALHNEYNK